MGDEVFFGYTNDGNSEVTVVVSVYNYEHYILEALGSVALQTLDDISLVIVDDCSVDNSLNIVLKWAREHYMRFADVTIIRHNANKGLPETRNTALRLVKTPYLFILDADNCIYPRCIEALLNGIKNSEASFAYCYNEMFGSSRGLFNIEVWDPEKLKKSNFIDAMVLIKKAVLDEVCGYTTSLTDGMEDYELWIKIAEIKGWGVQIPEILGRYRVHGDSMLHSRTMPQHDKLVNYIKDIHPVFFGIDRSEKLRRTRILIVISDFDYGGAQRFAIRLANELSIDNDVFLYAVRSKLFREGIFNAIDSRVHILESTANTEELRRYISEYSIDIINSHVYISDKHVFTSIDGLKDMPWVVSMHGCYENADYFAEIFDKEFNVYAKKILSRANKIIYVADKNKTFFRYVIPSPEQKSKKIYNGYIKKNVPSRSREELFISPGDFIFGIASRASFDKGWEEAIIATAEINKKDAKKAHLVLVGDSEYARQLQMRYTDYSFIHFVGYSPHPEEWIQIFDVGLLPTYFKSESLPNTIIEYLAYNKPVIATDIGETRKMLLYDHNTPAGILLSLKKKQLY
ncbi:MAG: glycosyltransferase [Planctomycetes bacterium]|nr:glycosyltransferase [Planctomycetota bacterium]